MRRIACLLVLLATTTAGAQDLLIPSSACDSSTYTTSLIGPIAALGDVDGDHHSDAGVAYLCSNTVSATYYTDVSIFPGSTTGLAAGTELSPPTSATEDPSCGCSYGRSFGGAGDVDGDGFDDIVVGAYAAYTLTSENGSAFVHLGAASGFTEIVLLPTEASDAERIGTSVAGAGDLNGDGYYDVVVGAPTLRSDWGTGSAYVYYGAATGFVSDEPLRLGAAGTSAYSVGRTVVGPGDVDGDGYADLLIQELDDSTHDPATWLYLGAASGLVSTPEVDLGDASRVTAAGDINGDGLADVLMGDESADGSSSDEGAALIFFGTSTGLNAAADQVLTASDAALRDHFGASIAGVGDLNNDGYDDIAVSAPRVDGLAADTGAIYIYFGASTGIDASSERKRVLIDATAGAYFGTVLGGIGDPDGDGYAHVATFAPSGSTSSSVSSKALAILELCLGDTDADGDGHCASNDCDDSDPRDLRTTLYVDFDGDGQGYDTTVACPGASGTAAVGGDCDDADPTIYTGATEICGDGRDNDCDGAGGADDDEDGDGLSWTEEQALGTDPCLFDTDGDGVPDGESTGDDDTGDAGDGDDGDDTPADTGEEPEDEEPEDEEPEDEEATDEEAGDSGDAGTSGSDGKGGACTHAPGGQSSGLIFALLLPALISRGLHIRRGGIWPLRRFRRDTPTSG